MPLGYSRKIVRKREINRIGGRAVLAVFALAALTAVGCGETVIDDAKTEAALEQNLEGSLGKKVSTVECPSGVEVETGTTFECTVSLAGGKEETATLRIANEDADVEVTGVSSG